MFCTFAFDGILYIQYGAFTCDAAQKILGGDYIIHHS